jgi:DeoR/GlpR family transcriptional regulator of sugar metabolism
MFPDQRRQKIYELLQENGSARVRDLSAAFDVTEPTIRQDLEKLENDGLIVREHGGAYIKDFAGPVETLTTSHTENLPQKRAIGELAASFVEINDSLIIDSGSTTTEFARCLAQKRGLTVVTNALNIALILGAEPSNEVMMTGGRFKGADPLAHRRNGGGTLPPDQRRQTVPGHPGLLPGIGTHLSGFQRSSGEESDDRIGQDDLSPGGLLQDRTDGLRLPR